MGKTLAEEKMRMGCAGGGWREGFSASSLGLVVFHDLINKSSSSTESTPVKHAVTSDSGDILSVGQTGHPIGRN